MATHEDAEEALLRGIKSLADSATTSGTSSHARNYAAGALHLTEALAWLTAPAQPHGGGATTGE